LAIAKRFHLALLEPPFDLLAKLPLEFRCRAVEYARFTDLARLKTPTFVKPADALNMSFDAGLYASARDIRSPGAIPLVGHPGMPSGDYVLVEKLKTAHNGDIVVAVVNRDDATLKRFYREGDNIRLQPSNATMNPIIVPAESVEVQGRVIGVLRKY